MRNLYAFICAGLLCFAVCAGSVVSFAHNGLANGYGHTKHHPTH
ncbi:hypothetical protein NZD89_07930 [Alicyclobacillus fastidiosus]|uniref:Lipoprotein n=1 Tax=Alicyclobacillus fastidiosus TaxID=392011 RepID=A0ABY6ZK52_9BACL|nr:hypothetical protein [Alicyclobacillus fastidiosus]WAH43309.1 hypothetical protein NZD89_07930 [Alicyclobacillus fastidiosus]